MKRFWMSTVVIIALVGMVGILSARADTMASSMQSDNTAATLTVVFGAPEVFAPVPAPVAPARPQISSTGTAAGSSPTTSARLATAGTPVPEPSTLFLIGIGVLGLVGLSRRKKN